MRSNQRSVPKRSKRSIPTPRRVGGTLVTKLKRCHNAGDAARIATDQGHSFNFTPTTLLDWSALQTLFGQFKVTKVAANFILRGEMDTTPSYPTFIVYEDKTVTGGPAIITDAMQKEPRATLTFGPDKTTGKFTYVPKVFPGATGGTGSFAVQLPASSVWMPTAFTGGAAPVFTGLAFWGASYNTTINSPIIQLVWEAWMEFRYPI